jgi:O-antigen/teichoic acid export membrane protein
MWRRLLQHSFSLALGQGINLAHQWLVPMAFLQHYGLEGYGAWLVVMAVAGQLANLDCGLQTYLVNRLTMLHEAGDHAAFRRLQSTGLLTALALAGGGLLLLLAAQWLPVERWLRLDWPATEARQVLLLLGAWVLLRLLQGQLAAGLRATGRPHRAQHWDNLQKALLLGSALWLLHTRSGLLWLAAAHLACVLVAIGLGLWDARRTLAFPTLREWNAREARQMFRPSLFFGLTTLNFLVLYEAPLLILQWTLGPAAVVTFATTRTLFSAARQLLTPVQLAVQQELPRALGNPDPASLRRLYHLSEVVALAGGSGLVTGCALLSPWLIQHWLHGRVTPTTGLLAMLATFTLATILKDQRNSLPLATNRHERATLLICVGYLATSAVGFGLTQLWREPGLLGAWIATELVLAAWLQRHNFRQFGWGLPPSLLRPVGLTLGLGATLWLALNFCEGALLPTRLGVAVLCAALAAAAALKLMGESLVQPAQRAWAAFNLHRQES